jgi:hypothetical protein
MELVVMPGLREGESDSEEAEAEGEGGRLIAAVPVKQPQQLRCGSCATCVGTGGYRRVRTPAACPPPL